MYKGYRVSEIKNGSILSSPCGIHMKQLPSECVGERWSHDIDKLCHCWKDKWIRPCRLKYSCQISDRSIISTSNVFSCCVKVMRHTSIRNVGHLVKNLGPLWFAHTELQADLYMLQLISVDSMVCSSLYVHRSVVIEKDHRHLLIKSVKHSSGLLDLFWHI